MAVRLNGWQRLWIVISTLYLVPVVGIILMFWPTAETTWHRDEFIERMPPELRANVDRVYASEWGWEDTLKKRAPEGFIPDPGWKERALTRFIPGPGSPTTSPGFVPAVPPPNDVLISAPVSFPNGAVLDIHVAKEGDTEPDARVGPAYWAVVEAEARAARWTMVWQMMLVWLIPCLTLYAVGWATAWVRRGFKNGAPARFN